MAKTDPNSLVDYLSSSGKDASLNSRAKLALDNGLVKTADEYITLAGQGKNGTINSTLLNTLRTAGSDKTISPNSVNNLDQAGSFINANQDADIASKTKTDEPPTRGGATGTNLDAPKIDTKTDTKTDNKLPEVVNMESSYNDLSKKYNVADLEDSLSGLKGAEQDLIDMNSANIDKIKNGKVAMNVIDGRSSVMNEIDQKKLDVIQKNIKTTTDLLTQKYKTIDTIMGYKKLDYDNAVDHYNTEFTNSLNMMKTTDGAMSIEEGNARANAQLMINAYKEAGVDYTKLSTTDKANLTKLGLQSGLGSDFYTNLVKSGANKDILTQVTSEDKTKTTIIYKDGSTKVISTGLPASKTGSSDLTQYETKNAGYASVDSIIDTKGATTTDGTPVTDNNGYVTPAGWYQLLKFGRTKGITRKEMMDNYMNKLFKDPEQGYSAYGITAQELL